MKFPHIAGVALALTVSAGQGALAQTDRIAGGFTTVTFSPAFIAATQGSGIAITDLGGNALPNSTEPLPATQGDIDLQTGVTNVIFKEGFQVTDAAKARLRVENLILHASQTASAITGDVIENGQLLGRREVFIVNKNPDLSLPLQAENGILTLPTLSLGLSPKFVTLLDGIVGPLVNPGTEVATATPIAIVVPDAAAP